jgi:PadR family transcriptional regulator, regulatory protein PadR
MHAARKRLPTRVGRLGVRQRPRRPWGNNRRERVARGATQALALLPREQIRRTARLRAAARELKIAAHVLLALVRLRTNAYGMTIRQEIETRTGRNLSIGAVYATLERLEEKGYVSSARGEPAAERGGRAKRLFRIEAAGQDALQSSHDVFQKMTAGLGKRWWAT